MHTHTHTGMHTQVYTHMYTHMHTLTHTLTHIYIHTLHIHTYTHINTHAHTHRSVCTYAHTHTHTHTHTHPPLETTAGVRAPQLGRGLMKSCRMLTALILCRQPQQLCVHMQWSRHIQEVLFHPGPPSLLAFTVLLLPLCDGSRPCGCELCVIQMSAV